MRLVALRRSAVLLAAGVFVVACGGGGGAAAGDGGESGPGRGSGDDAGAERTREPTEPARPVLVLGDSLTLGAELWGDLDATLAELGWQADVVAEDGEAVGWGIEQVRDRAAVPSVVVVGLGTNPGGSAERFAADAATLVAELTDRGATTIVWWPPGDVDDAGRVERAQMLRSAAGGPLVVPDWPTELAEHPEWVAGDGIHLTDRGYRGLATFLGDALDSVHPVDGVPAAP